MLLNHFLNFDDLGSSVGGSHGWGLLGLMIWGRLWGGHMNGVPGGGPGGIPGVENLEKMSNEERMMKIMKMMKKHWFHKLFSILASKMLLKPLVLQHLGK